MDYIKLNEFFNEKTADFRKEIKHIPKLNGSSVLYNDSRKFFYDDYTGELFRFHIEGYILQLNKEFEKHLNFCFSYADKEKYIAKQFKNNRKYFLKNWFSHCFSVDNFHEEMFSVEKMDIVFASLYHRNKKNFERNFESDTPKSFCEIATEEYVKLIDCLNLLMQVKYYMGKLKEIKNQTGNSKGNYDEKYWFKIGVLFAKGEMTSLLDKYSNNCTAVAKHLGNSNYRPYISDTLNTTKRTDKNIYSDEQKMQVIIDHCNEQKIAITDPVFIAKANQLTPFP